MALIKVFDHVFLTRPVLFFPIWTVFLAGLVQSQRSGQDGLDWPGLQGYLFSPVFWSAFVTLTFLMAASFIINQFTDMKSDRENDKLFLLANGLVSTRAALIETLLLIGLGLFLALLAGLPLLVLALILFLITGVGYSLAPFAAKDRPLAGLLVNVLGGLGTFLIGWQVGLPPKTGAVVAAVPYMLAIGAVYLLTTIADRSGDALAGKRTFAVQYGPGQTIGLALVLELAACICAALLSDPVILIPALAALPLFVMARRSATIKSTVVASRSAILILCGAVVLCFPAYLALLFAVFLAAKWYYQRRFNLNYPSLTPAARRG
jgi:4-hydroxybenzoate polyprenyltransferase